MSIFSKLSASLAKTRSNFVQALSGIFVGKVDEDFYDELEEALILADVGVDTSLMLTDRLRSIAKERKIKEREALWDVLLDEIAVLLEQNGNGGLTLEENRLNIIVMIGVNGAGKTTTIGKIASRFSSQGKKVLMAAGDTFRAAAADQLAIWAERTGAMIVRQAEGADPAAVVYDAIAAAKARHVDLLLIDTAGRLQNKTNLMTELAKIGRVISREADDAHVESLLVLDAGTGQNAISQARQFSEAVPLTGVILTKLDGTAKGGAIVGIANESELPIRLIGVGEKVEDLRDFEPHEFAKALFAE